MIGKNETLNQMKDAIREDPTVPIKKVYNPGIFVDILDFRLW
jgi:hypothetical protein